MLKSLILVLALITSASTFAATSNTCSAVVNGQIINSAQFNLIPNAAPFRFQINQAVTVEASSIETCVSKYDCSSSLALKAIVGETTIKTTKRLNWKEMENSNRSQFPTLEIESEGILINVLCYQIN